MTALGAIVLWRTYFSCNSCGLGGYAADRVLGLEGFLTRQATRLICLLGGQNSFAVTERLLKECCGWTISDERIRQACQAESPRIAGFRAESPAVAKAFADAPGDVEFQTDAAKVNTTEGWRDMKIGIFARRERGEPSTPENWDKRHLPAPATRVAFAAIETIDDFAPRWSKWAVRLGIEDLSTITVLGDGAEWIWNAASREFPGCTQVLDIYHGAEHIADAARTRFGEGTTTAKEWLDRGRSLLLSDGWAGLCDHLGQTMTSDDAPEDRTPLDDLMGYFATHTSTQLLPPFVYRAIDRQRNGRRGSKEPGRSTTQADRRSVAGRQRQPNGRVMLSDVQRPLGSLLGILQLSARNYSRTRSCHAMKKVYFDRARELLRDDCSIDGYNGMGDS